jgi:GAF domain-containing protein
MTRDHITAALEALENVIASEGVHAALRTLNARAPHRFTGVYRLDPPMLRNMQLFDRENPTLHVGADSLLRETYCSITGSGAAPFFTADSRGDDRLQAHPARESTLSYCGVPLLDASGAALGTLCHFDLLPQPVPESELELLQAAAPLILAALRENGTISER